MERSGNEWRWKRHRSVTFRGNRWYRHSEQVGSHAIDFMQEFFGMNFPEAVTYLLNGETGQVIKGSRRHIPPEQRKAKEQEKPEGQKKLPEPEGEEPKQFTLPEKNDTMKRVYAYLMQKRYIGRDILSFFAKRGTLYESKEHHNAVFVGVEKTENRSTSTRREPIPGERTSASMRKVLIPAMDLAMPGQGTACMCLRRR